VNSSDANEMEKDSYLPNRGLRGLAKSSDDSLNFWGESSDSDKVRTVCSSSCRFLLAIRSHGLVLFSFL
jgi:hypothetical protein